MSRTEARRRLLHQLRARSWALALVVALGLFAANEIARSSFAAWGSWPSLLADFAPFALAAVATTPQMLSGAGGVDISVGPLLNLVSVLIVGELMAHGAGSPWLDVPAALALGALVGAINGVLVGVFRYQAVLATLCGLFVLSGAGQALLSSPASSSEAWLTDLGNQIGPVPGGLILIMAPLVVWWILSRTTYLRQLYAVGGDEVAAYSAGVDVARVRIVAYTLGGLFAATHKPKARSNVSTKPCNAGSAPDRPPAACPSCSASSTPSASTTTRNAHTAHSTDEPRPTPTARPPKRSRQRHCRKTTTGCATTGSAKRAR